MKYNLVTDFYYIFPKNVFFHEVLNVIMYTFLSIIARIMQYNNHENMCI